MAAVMAATSFGAFAADEGVTIIADPAQGSTLAEFPETFTLTFEGPASIAKNISVGNPVFVTDPAGTRKQCTAPNWDFDTNTITIKTSADFADYAMAGDWTVELRAGGVQYVDADGVRTKCSSDIFTYTVGAAQEEKLMVFDPSIDEEQEEFPETFTVTFNGPESIKKNLSVSRVCVIYAPGSTDGLTATPTWDNANCKVTFETLPALNRNIPGEYRLHFNAGGIQLVYPDGTEKIEEMDFYYTVKGNGDVPPVGGDEVKYDIELIGTTPKLASGFDASARTWETIQFTFGAGGLQPTPDAVAIITGPNYNQRAALKFLMGNDNATWMKGAFMDPVYNGTYTLTIPQGAVGNADYLANPETGRANAAVSLTFEVTGAKDMTGDEKQTTFNPLEVLPVPAGKVETLNFVMLSFEDDVYYNEGLTFNVGIKTDPAAVNFSSFGTATVSGSGNSVRLDISPKPTTQAEYLITIPQESFRNAENAEEATNFNSALSYNFFLRPVKVSVEVTSRDPKAESYVEGFHVGEGVTINTDNNEIVAKMDITITSYELDNDAAAPATIVNATTTTKNDEGAICWLAEEDMPFDASKYYTVDYTLYDEEGNKIADGTYDFYGADGFVGVESTFGAEAVKAVYNMQGMRLGNDINALPAGLYIIDGKKVMIRK
ncbi:MAG: copper resistance protein CopC [Muribaculaceae bacterium]|nr:copper resistance protein CopC [Muribaculaceae bacterium]